MNLTTTLTKIYKHAPCDIGFEILIRNTTGSEEFSDGKQYEESIARQFAHLTDEEKNKEITLLDILDSNGVEDAFWALRCWGYKDYCLLLADVAESVLHIWEEEYPDDDRTRRCIEGIRLFHAVKLTGKELER